MHRLASVSGAWHKRRGRADAMPDFAIERGCAGLVCGVDEAGRGPLAGPVVAAAVILDRRRFRGLLRRELDDSKVLTRETREVCCRALFACAKIGVGAASVGEIDRINILRASLRSMARAVAALGLTPDIALVDGNVAPAILPGQDGRQGRRVELLNRRRLGRRQGDARPNHAWPGAALPRLRLG